jgi:hypothetical protein
MWLSESNRTVFMALNCTDHPEPVVRCVQEKAEIDKHHDALVWLSFGRVVHY